MALGFTASGVWAATNVKTGNNYVCNSGYTVTCGMALYIDPNSGDLIPATAAAAAGSGAPSTVCGLALNNAYDQQPVLYITKGLLNVGAISGVVQGTQYVLDPNGNGGIVADSVLTSGAWVSQIGYGLSGNAIQVLLNNTGVQYQ